MNMRQQLEMSSVLQMGIVPLDLKATELTGDRQTQVRCRPGWRLCKGGVCSLSRFWACELDKCHRSCPQQCITATSGFNMRQTPPGSFLAGFESSPALKEWRICHGIRPHRLLRTSLLVAATVNNYSIRIRTPHLQFMDGACPQFTPPRWMHELDAAPSFREAAARSQQIDAVGILYKILRHVESHVKAAYDKRRA